VVAAARAFQPHIRRQEKPTVPRPRSSPAPSQPLPTLLRRYRDVHRQYVELERELGDLDRQIVAAGRPPRPHRRRTESVEATDELRAVLRVLQEAESPLPPREIASRLGVPPKTVSRRLARALHLGYVERAGQASYRVADAVPSL
jgi:DNA-directed RNA polymerase specialized sigma24 family protein